MKIIRLIIILIFIGVNISIKAQTDIPLGMDTLGFYISELLFQDKIDSSPLLVINGVAIAYDDFKTNNPTFVKSEIKQIDYLSKNSKGAFNIYGDSGKNGVILITTMNPQEIVQKKSSRPLENSKVLFLKDAFQISREELDKIDSNDIESIEVIKNKDSIRKYTSEDYDGIVIIKIKKK